VKTELPNKIIISRTDSIGDVLLTIPLCFWIKKKFPKTKIVFLCKNYTIPVLNQVSVIDEIVPIDGLFDQSRLDQISFFKKINADWIIHVFPNKKIASLAKKAKIKNRVGTSHRLFHFFNCNKKVAFTRKKSSLHESQLNFHLLRPLGLTEIPSFKEINNSQNSIKKPVAELPDALLEFINERQFVVLHPKSQGSALEWPVDNYIKLSNKLVEKNTAVVFTGTSNEGEQFREKIPSNKLIFDSTGKLSLGQLMTLIYKSNAIVACSTGPLHIGGIYGVKSIGLFSSRKPIHPGRWKPLGLKSNTIVFDEHCEPCRNGQSCRCIEKIPVNKVLEKILD
jgi:ADP-heptose:LPS heptosyltransferase